ncbi:MAG: choice-of-anchor Q domain-containing protein [Anaerolineales bacterium]|nr:MAG: choice-of-anchor Q domain-containing protein [Anaerolineales bacterium]
MKFFPRVTNLLLAFALALGALTVAPVNSARAGTLTVTNTNDSGAGSLRQAIADAVSGDTIDATGISGTITLASQLSITKNLTITGPGSDVLTVSGNNAVRVFDIQNNLTVSITGLTVANGQVVNSYGAGIWSRGILTLNDVNVINNTIIEGASPFVRGGGIHISDGATLMMTNGIVSGNTAVQNGGGIHVGFNGGVSLDNVVIHNNHLSNPNGGGGGLSIRENTAAILNRVTITNNSAPYAGGGLYSDTALNITNSVIANNYTLSDAANGNGGGLYIAGSATSSLSNVTISGNWTDNIFNTSIGAGIAVYQPATLNLNNVTVANNTSEGRGGGIYVQNGVTLNIGNSIIGGNTASNHTEHDCSGTLNSLGHNLIEDTTGCTVNGDATGNLTAIDPKLAPLADYGGPTMTQALQFDSPAVDAGKNATCAIADQRGVSRPIDGNNDATAACDMGAYEFEPETTPPAVVSIVRAGANPAFSDSVEFTVTFSEPVVDVDINDFSLDASGITGASVTDVTGSGDARAVIVDTGSGNGTIQLDMPDTADISDLSGNQINGLPFAGEEYTILKTPTFADVPFNYSAWQYIEAIYNAGITGGCTTTPLNYCPNNTVTRAQMAIFLLRGIHGSSYTPPAVGDGTGFNDVPTTHSAAAWIKQLAAEGITGGCGNGNYCPNQAVTRAQMAIFLLRAKYGDDYVPPAVGGSSGFNDVPAGSSTAPWIKQLAAENITGGCGGGNYCPNNPVTRAQMAIFLQRTFNLPLP